MFARSMRIVCAAALLSGPVGAQGYTPYDTYRDAYGGPHYTGNLTPAPDDRTVLGPTVAAGDPFLTRTRPARGWGEIEDLGAGFWEHQADRIRQRQQDADEADARRRLNDMRGQSGFGTPHRPN
ncbi:hypothetical protein [Azospirillum sp. sgz301742]